jgi:hypothetical protein
MLTVAPAAPLSGPPSQPMFYFVSLPHSSIRRTSLKRTTHRITQHNLLAVSYPRIKSQVSVVIVRLKIPAAGCWQLPTRLHSVMSLKSIIFILLIILYSRKGKKANTQTRIRKLTKTQQQQKHKWETAQYNHVQQRQQKQRSRFPQEYKSETSYTPEDGHVGRNM